MYFCDEKAQSLAAIHIFALTFFFLSETGARAGDSAQASRRWCEHGVELRPLHRGWGWADDRSGTVGQRGGLQIRQCPLFGSVIQCQLLENACSPTRFCLLHHCHLAAPPLALSPLSVSSSPSVSVCRVYFVMCLCVSSRFLCEFPLFGLY